MRAGRVLGENHRYKAVPRTTPLDELALIPTLAIRYIFLDQVDTEVVNPFGPGDQP